VTIFPSLALETTQALTEMSNRKSFKWVKRGRPVRLTTPPPSVSWLYKKCEILNISNTTGLHGLFQGKLNFTLLQFILLHFTFFTFHYFILLHCTSLHFTFLYFTSLFFTLLHFTIFYFASLQFTLLYFTLLYFTLLHFTSLHLTFLSFSLLYFTLLQFTLLHFTSVYFTSLCFMSLHFTSLYFTSLHFTSLHLASLHFTLLYFTLLIENSEETSKSIYDWNAYGDELEQGSMLQPCKLSVRAERTKVRHVTFRQILMLTTTRQLRQNSDKGSVCHFRVSVFPLNSSFA
jgi:hypothetical protein